MGRPNMIPLDESYSILEAATATLGFPPTIREFQDALGVGSKRTASRYLRRMYEAGWVRHHLGARGYWPARDLPANTSPAAILKRISKASQRKVCSYCGGSMMVNHADPEDCSHCDDGFAPLVVRPRP